MTKYEVSGHEPSYLPEGRKWKLVRHDEFDGKELDRSKWDYRLCMMGKRHKTWTDDGVVLDGESHAVFSIFREGRRDLFLPTADRLQFHGCRAAENRHAG